MKHSGLYELLGLSPDATPEELKEAYRRKAQETHSDHGGSDEAFVKIKEAYETLSDQERRERYDRTGETGDGAANVYVGIAIDLFVKATMNDPEDIDQVIRTTVDGKIDALEREAAQFEKALERAEAAFGRIKKAPERDFLREFLAAQRIEIRRQIDHVEVQIEDYSAAYMLLKQYVFSKKGGGLGSFFKVAAGSFGGFTTHP